jgi:hypothetical protein
MPRYPSNPILLDHALSLSLKDLKRLGYIKEHHSVSGVVSWTRQGVRTSSVSVWVDLAFSHSLTLSYSSEGVKHDQRFNLIAKPSNLGKGRYWFIESPESGNIGSKVYLVSGRFRVRTDASGCMYEKQIESKYYRGLSMALGDAFGYEDLYFKLYKKGFKKTYAGKPTKRYCMLIEQIRRAEAVDSMALERLLG